MSAATARRCACWSPTTRRSRASGCCACWPPCPTSTSRASAATRRRCWRACAPASVDVVLLDIQMPELSGIEALQLFPADGPLVVFCTAHAAHAVSAFDVGAVDYLLKPVDGGRLRKALDRARQRARAGRHRRSAAEAPPLDRLALPTRQGIVLLDPRDVTHALLADELVTVYAAGQQYLSALSLQELESRLPAGDLRARAPARAGQPGARRAPAARRRWAATSPQTSGGHTVEVSRQAARELRKRLGLR